EPARLTKGESPMATLHEPKSLAAPIICQDSNPKTISDFAKQRHQEENAVDGPAHDAMNIWTDFTGRGVTTAAYRPRIMVADPDHPELFSQFVYPQFRGFGLGGLLEHFWWAYLDSHGYSTGFMRMELDSNQTLVERRLHSGYCRRATPEELGQQFVTACRNCE